jgi:hypothetical protein
MKTLEERFQEKMIPEPNSGCWLWLGAVRGWRRSPMHGGYGVLWRDGDNFPAHRVAYELYVGPIPEGMVIDHKCRNTRCVNPDHLRPITGRENIMCGNGASARNAAKTHCSRGHSLTGDNVKWVPHRGTEHRRCWACLRQHQADWRDARRRVTIKEFYEPELAFREWAARR